MLIGVGAVATSAVAALPLAYTIVVVVSGGGGGGGGSPGKRVRGRPLQGYAPIYSETPKIKSYNDDDELLALVTQMLGAIL